MSKFKVGDLVKIVKPNIKEKNEFKDAIRRIIKEDKSISWILEDTKPWCWYEDELELVEEQTKPTEITITAKPLKITVDDLNNSYTIHDAIIDKNKQLYDWWKALDKEKMLPGQEKFNMMFNEIWKKENPMIKKEGNEMIESMNLIDLYASKHKENIERETKDKIEELRKNCDVINKYNELVEQFEKECDDLYLSQFTEEERNKLISNNNVEYDNKPLLHSDMWRNKYSINYTYTNDEIIKLETDMVNKVEELNDLVKTAKAHVGIAKTKEEVEEILTRYGIIDKKGKLVTK